MIIQVWILTKLTVVKVHLSLVAHIVPCLRRTWAEIYQSSLLSRYLGYVKCLSSPYKDPKLGTTFIKYIRPYFANLLRRKCLYWFWKLHTTVVSRRYSKCSNNRCKRLIVWVVYCMTPRHAQSCNTIYSFFDIFLFWQFTRQSVHRGRECVLIQRGGARHHFFIHSRRTKNSTLQMENLKKMVMVPWIVWNQT